STAQTSILWVDSSDRASAWGMELVAVADGGPATAAEATPTPTPTGVVRVEKVRGRSAVTRCFAKYPLKIIVPSKVGPASSGAVWLYVLTYGGGIVSVSLLSDSIILFSVDQLAPADRRGAKCWLFPENAFCSCRGIRSPAR
uniref:Uncharacterized protein n=2 Tax=Aegilops tauschii subsp. strangulata TaxID=200361 RepID=A0A453NJS6_AEGTS